MNGVRENCPRVTFEYHNRARSAKKYCYKIIMAKGKNTGKIRGQYYRKLLKAAWNVLDLSISCRAALDSAGLGFYEDLAASLLKGEFDRYMALAARAIEQCERRVLEGDKVPASEKIVSIFEDHTDIIRRGKTMSPTEFGHKVLAATGTSGIVTQYKVCEGNPGDNELFGGILEKHVAQFGAAPRGNRRQPLDAAPQFQPDPLPLERLGEFQKLGGTIGLRLQPPQNCGPSLSVKINKSNSTLSHSMERFVHREKIMSRHGLFYKSWPCYIIFLEQHSQ